MTKTQREIPAPFKVIGRANAGAAIRLNNATITPIFNPFFAFSIFMPPFFGLHPGKMHSLCQKITCIVIICNY